MELEFLCVFVQDGFGGPRLDPHGHRQGVELHVLVRLYQVIVVVGHHDGVLAHLVNFGFSGLVV